MLSFTTFHYDINKPQQRSSTVVSVHMLTQLTMVAELQIH